MRCKSQIHYLKGKSKSCNTKTNFRRFISYLQTHLKASTAELAFLHTKKKLTNSNVRQINVSDFKSKNFRHMSVRAKASES
jgi:hypothetical protein